MQDLSRAQTASARELATRIAQLGHRGWIVGGAVRDLALGRSPSDVDMTSAATPDEIERVCDHVVPVGREFGTLVLHVLGIEIQHTTFRSEAGYSDARRPDAVTFGTSVEADASRRDFTCNALYLDPLTDEVLDPEGGLVDLRSGQLRCVGVARDRFREDGLRLVRMARFAAQLELEPASEVLEAARDARGALAGVSPERVLVELETLFDRRHGAAALGWLARCELLFEALPGLAERYGGEFAAAFEGRAAVLRALPPVPGLELGLAALYGPPAEAPLEGEGARAAALELLARLRVSRGTRATVGALWRTGGAIADLDRPPESRAKRVRWMRGSEFEGALLLARAWNAVARRGTSALDALDTERRGLSEAELHPVPLLGSDALASAGVPRGPWWGTLIAELETLQLDGLLADRKSADAWLARRAAEIAHDGGNTRRSAKDNG